MNTTKGKIATKQNKTKGLVEKIFSSWKISDITNSLNGFNRLKKRHTVSLTWVEWHLIGGACLISVRDKTIPAWLLLCAHAWFMPWTHGKKNLQYGTPGFSPWVGKAPWRRERLPTPVFWPRESHVLHSPWGHRVGHFYFHSRDFLWRFRYLHYSLVPATMVSSEA